MTKPVLNLLPGTMCNDLLWQDIKSDLEQHFQLNYLAYPYCNDMSDLTIALVKQLPKSGPVNLLGFSLGGYLAVHISKHIPDRISSLVSLSNSATALPEAELKQRKQTLSWLERFEYAGIPDQKLKTMLSKSNADNQHVQQIIRQMEKQLGFHNIKWQLHVTTDREDHSDFINHVNFPCAFLYGDEDRLIDKDWMNSLNKRAQCHINQISHCGHMLPLEQPQVLRSCLMDFYQRYLLT